METFGIVGGGVMGSVIFALLRTMGVKNPIIVYTLDPKKSSLFGRKGASVGNDSSRIAAVDVIFLAVKPKDFLTADIHVRASTLVISVMAGISIQTIRKKLGADKVIRIMTNTAAEFGKGYTVWTAQSSKLTSADRKMVQALCVATGKGREVAKEADIDRATVILGSGPAFILDAISSFIDGARALKLSQKEAEDMVIGALEGAQMLLTQDRDMLRIIQRITSKGGTTEAGLLVFKNAETNKIWRRALRSSLERAHLLRKSFSI